MNKTNNEINAPTINALVPENNIEAFVATIFRIAGINPLEKKTKRDKINGGNNNQKSVFTKMDKTLRYTVSNNIPVKSAFKTPEV